MVCVSDDVGNFRDRCLVFAMQAIAVGAFHQHQVGFGDHGRVAQYRRAVLAEITAEDQLPADATGLYPDLDTGGTENMAGILKADADPGQ